jgi:hypothetical protein
MLVAGTTGLLWAGLLLALDPWSPLPAQPGPGPAAPGAPALEVLPTRLVLDGRKRNAEVSLFNLGGSPQTFRIAFIHMEMDDQGQMRELPLEQELGKVHPQDLIRFAPREVTLGPKEWQTVRVQVRKPPDLPTGEYRVNLVFQEVPPPPPADLPDEASTKAEHISIQLIPIWGLSIPVIVRQGETSAQVAIVDPVLDPPGQTLSFRVTRSGNQSVYGNIKATFVAASGRRETVAEADAVAVYTPNAGRTFKLPLRPSQAPLAKGMLLISFDPPEEEGGSPFAQCQLDLP